MFVQFAKFSFVGLVATTTHVLIVLVLVEWFDVKPLISNGFAFLMATCVSYYGNQVWTFQVEYKTKHSKHAPRFFLISSAGFILSQFIMYTVVEVFQSNYQIALVLIVILIPVITFAANKYWTFAA